MSAMNEHQREVDENYARFREVLPSLLETHGGRFALMHKREIVAYFDTFRDCFVAGSKIYPDGLFSIQEITAAAANLGFFSCAVH